MYRCNLLRCASSGHAYGSISVRHSSSLATPKFRALVQALKSSNKTCTVIESSCGGLISSSLMSVPGSSKVYFGGTIAYNTKKSGKLLVSGDDALHDKLLGASSNTSKHNSQIDVQSDLDLSEETKQYIRSKIVWTREAALSYCKQMNTDFAIAEGGATGPTFRPSDMKNGFGVLAVAERKSDGEVVIAAQQICHSTHNDRESNMRLFADKAAQLCIEAIPEAPKLELEQTADDVDTNDGIFLDRSSHIRGDSTIMQELYKQKDALHVILRGTEVLFATPTELALPTLQNLEYTMSDKAVLDRRTFLGRLGPSQPVFGLFLPKDARDDIITYQKSYFANTRARAPMLNPIHNELALTATAYFNWQDTHQYCSMCGSPLEFIQGGTCAKCSIKDGKPHFHWPRQDPSIIVLVNNPSRTHALLARSPRHPEYLYTALAGFVEAGETFEQGVHREVYEEVGVLVDQSSIEYIASQPWPFPRSCMIGMHATTTHDLAPINIDPHEIVDAQWFEKETVYHAARDTDAMGAVLDRQVVEDLQAKGEWNGKLLVPSKGVLARTLVDHWLESD